MKIDNYSKALGIIYATSHMMHCTCLEMSVDEMAMSLYNEGLTLIEKGNYPEPAAVLKPVEEAPRAVPVEESPVSEPETEQVPTVEESSAAQEPEPVKEAKPQEPKTTTANVWWHGEDSYIRVSASADEAVCNRPIGSRKTDTQVKNKWYYLKQRKMLLSKGDRVWYQGNNENLCQKFTPAGRGAILGSISAITDDKTYATVFFDGDTSAYQIPICDIIRAGEA